MVTRYKYNPKDPLLDEGDVPVDSQAIVVFITAPDADLAERIARHLVENRLVACVNLLTGIQSIYTWQGQIQKDSEVLLIVKTRPELFEEQIVPAVKAIHPYDVPEIIALPVRMGSEAYINWINTVTTS